MEQATVIKPATLIETIPAAATLYDMIVNIGVNGPKAPKSVREGVMTNALISRIQGATAAGLTLGDIDRIGTYAEHEIKRRNGI